MSDDKGTVVLDIDRLGARGDGVAGRAGGSIYVRGALPGERVRVGCNGERGRLVDVIRASGDRQRPPCRYFGTCGGCVAQHMAPALYLAWKQDTVREAFAKRGLDPALDQTIALPPGSRRRTALTATHHPRGFCMGYHAEASHVVINVEDCPLLCRQIASALPELRDLALAACAAKGSLRLLITATEVGIDVALAGALRPLNAEQRVRLSELAAAARVARLTVEGDVVVQRATPVVTLSGVQVEPPPGAFLQATVASETAIAAVIARSIGGRVKRTADLFCGVGTFAFAMASRVPVMAIDADAASTRALASAAARARGLKPIEVLNRDLLHEPLSRKELEGFDAVVMDPPRVGARAQAEMLARSPVPLVIAVSCNPATLARDCRILVDGGYRLDAVTPIDQFLWSAQVEAVAVLRRDWPRR